MKLEEYEQFVEKSLIKNDGELWYPALGLAGEAGEVVDEIKKFYRDDTVVLSSSRKEKIILELGDVMFYVAVIAKRMGTSVGEVLTANVEKLVERKANGGRKMG